MFVTFTSVDIDAGFTSDDIVASFISVDFVARFDFSIKSVFEAKLYWSNKVQLPLSLSL